MLAVPRHLAETTLHPDGLGHLVEGRVGAVDGDVGGDDAVDLNHLTDRDESLD